MRFHVTDPILKGILRCTDCVVAAEERIQKPSSTSQTGASIDTPSQQKSMSEGIIPDYTIYLLSHGVSENRMPVIGIVEVKRKEDFNNKAVCQTIGYHIVSRVSNTIGNTVVPPLLILLCQDQLKFMFLPFTLDGSHCIDAIVTPSINNFEQDSCLIDKSWFVFACLYIIGSPSVDLALMKNTDYPNLQLHMKKTYEEFMEPNVKELADELKETQEELKEVKRESERNQLELQKQLEEVQRESERKERNQLELRATISQLQKHIDELESGATSDTRGSKRPGCEDPPQETNKK